MCLRRRDFYPPFHLLTTSFQVVADSDKVTPQPSLSSHCTPRVSSTTPLNSCSLIPSRASLPLSGHVKPESRLQTIRTQLRGSLERGQHKPLGSLAGLRTAQGLPALHHACYNNSLLSPAALLCLLPLPHPAHGHSQDQAQTDNTHSPTYTITIMRGKKRAEEHTQHERPGLNTGLAKWQYSKERQNGMEGQLLTPSTIPKPRVACQGCEEMGPLLHKAPANNNTSAMA